MLTNIIIPVMNTEGGEYRYDGKLSREQYEDMVMNQFLSTNGQMNRFVDNMVNGVSNINRYAYDVPENMSLGPESIYDYYTAQALVQDVNKKDIDESFFMEHSEKLDMFIVILNINPNTLEGDAESEIRFWLDDSKNIHEDRRLDTKTKMKSLPARSLKIEIGDRKGNLENCKILQDYSSNKWPFYFAIIVEKITFEK